MFSRAESRFLVPNEAEQEAAGQIQRRSSGETAGKLSYQRILSGTWTEGGRKGDFKVIRN